MRDRKNVENKIKKYRKELKLSSSNKDYILFMLQTEILYLRQTDINKKKNKKQLKKKVGHKV